MMPTPSKPDPYASWSDLYDVMIDWPGRLRAEAPRVLALLRATGGHTVLDFACGTGRHSWMLAQNGYRVIGTDVSRHMIEMASHPPDPSIVVEAAPGFAVWDAADEPPATLRNAGPVDAVICFGNSFSHLLRADAERALGRLATVVRPGGSLLFQMKNLMRRVRDRDVFLPLVRRETPSGDSALFLRCYEFLSNPQDTLIFHLYVTVTQPNALMPREGAPPERMHHEASMMQIWRPDDLAETMRRAGFEQVVFEPTGGTPEQFSLLTTEDFYVTARRPAASGTAAP